MIDPRTCERLFVQLAESLRNSNMGWIVDQVYESIAEGKALEPVAVKVSRARPRISRGEEDEPDVKRSPYRRRVEFSPQERLVLLAKATAAVVNDSLAIDAALTSHYPTFSFRPEIPEENERALDIVEPTGERRDVHSKLITFIEQLITEAEG